MKGGVRPVIDRENNGTIFLPSLYYDIINISDLLDPKYMKDYFTNVGDSSTEVSIDEILIDEDARPEKYTKKFHLDIDPELINWRKTRDYDFVIFSKDKDRIRLISTLKPNIYNNSEGERIEKYWSVTDPDDGEKYDVCVPGHSAIKWPDEMIGDYENDPTSHEPRQTIDDDKVFYAGNITFNEDGTLNELTNDSGHFIPLPITRDEIVHDYYNSKFPQLIEKSKEFEFEGGFKNIKRKINKRKTNKRKTNKRKTNKKKTNKRKTNKRKTNKKKTNKRKTRRKNKSNRRWF